MTYPVPLAFAHANGFPGGSYERFLAALRNRYAVSAVPRLGHQPERFPVDHGWRGLTEELEDFLTPLPKPLLGVGHSLGAVLMFLAAQRYPEWFRGLVMLEPPLINGLPGLAFRLLRGLGQVDRITPAGQSRGRRDYWADRDEARAYFESRGLFRHFDPDCLEDYLDAGLERQGDGWRLHFRPEVEVAIFRTTPVRVTAMPRLRLPGVVVNGRDSGQRFLDAGLRHAHRQHMRHELWSGGHLFPLERPAESAHRLMALLETLEEPAS